MTKNHAIYIRYLEPLLISCALLSLSLSSCRKFITVGAPPNSQNSANVYATDASAISVLTGIYSTLSSGSFGGLQQIPSVSYFAGLSADELTLYSTSSSPAVYYYQNDLSPTQAGTEAWGSIYQFIYICNSAIEGLSASTSLTPGVKQQLYGEAEFMRAFFYYYLVNLYGDVPLVLSSTYTLNSNMARTPASDVYQQIIKDLEDAKSRLSPVYVDVTVLNTTQERTRPTEWAALALLARCYLNTKDWAGADSASSAIINNYAQYGIVDSLDSAFLKNNREAIWQLQPVNGGQNTPDAQFFVLPATGPDPYSFPVYLSSFLMNDFESGDLRRASWTDSVSTGGSTYYFPYKYKVNLINLPVTEYEVVLRLSEQYLIRAEAEANGAGMGITAAVSDLNSIRGRAGLGVFKGTQSPDSVLASIYHERRVELFTEWGSRWIDLKRTGLIDMVMPTVCTQKGGQWTSSMQLYPIPLSDIEYDNKLVQNPGYQ